MPCDKRKCRIHKTIKKKCHLSPKTRDAHAASEHHAE